MVQLCAFLMKIFRHVCIPIKKFSMERKTFYEVDLKNGKDIRKIEREENSEITDEGTHT